MEILLVILFSPWFWLIGFLSKIVFQFLLAQKLNHKHTWFAFLPILNTVQWFQMGKTSPWHMVWLFLPVLGVLFFFYHWFRATINLCERAGERGSFSVLLLFPYVNSVALIRLAFKTGFWVKTDLEKDLIQKTIKGLEAGHSPAKLKAFATSHGVKLEDFEIALDRAQIIKKHNLKISSTKFASPVALNIGVGVFYVFAALFFVFFLLTVGVMSFFGALFSGDFSTITYSNETEAQQTQAIIPEEVLNQYEFLMRVESYSQTEPASINTKFEGQIIKGNLNGLNKVYVLDESFSLIDLVEKPGHTFRLDEGTVTISIHQLDPQKVKYVGVTPDLAQKNKASTEGDTNLMARKAILKLEAQKEVAQGSNLKDVVVQVKMNDLHMSDGLYIYNSDLALIGAAKIKQIYKTEDPNQAEAKVIKPGQSASLRLELARPNINGALYLTPYQNLNPWSEYLELINS